MSTTQTSDHSKVQKQQGSNQRVSDEQKQANAGRQGERKLEMDDNNVGQKGKESEHEHVKQGKHDTGYHQDKNVDPKSQKGYDNR